jgi:hypothetical protein
MQYVTRRRAMQLIGTTGAAVLVTFPVGAAGPAEKKQKPNCEPSVPSKAQPDSHGPPLVRNRKPPVTQTH